MTTLAQLAAETFGPFWGALRPAETALLESAQNGKIADLRPSNEPDDPLNHPAQAENWAPERRIRADLLWWICRNEDVAKYVDPAGIAVSGAYIQGVLNLNGLSLRFPLSFIRCHFAQAIVVSFAEIQSVRLDGSRVPFINAEKLTVQGDFSMQNGFHSGGEVRLNGAKIGGDLDCTGGKFVPGRDLALSASAVDVGGSVKLTHGFQASGIVRFVRAKIAGDLDCTGGLFTNPRKWALHCDEADIGGSVLMGEGLDLPGLQEVIGGHTSGDRRIKEAIAMIPDGTELDKILRRFTSDGEVAFDYAKIGRDLNCDGGHFRNPRGRALSLTGANIGGSFMLGFGPATEFQSQGEIVLAGSRIGGDFNCARAKLIGQHEPKADASKINDEAKAEEPESAVMGRTIDALGATIQGSVLLDQDFFSRGEIRLSGAVIHGNLRFNGLFANEGGDAILANQVVVEGSVTFGQRAREGFIKAVIVPVVVGTVKFGGARIGGDFWVDVHFRGKGRSGIVAQAATVAGRFVWGGTETMPDTTLDLRNASVTTLVIEEEREQLQAAKRWPAEVVLLGLSYQGIEVAGGVAGACEWLERQPIFASQPYQRLSDVLRNEGKEADAQFVLITREDRRRRAGGLTALGRLWAWVLRITIGYGYKPHWALGWALAVIAAGYFFVEVGYRDGVMRATGKAEETYEPISPLVYSADAFLPIVNLRQKDHWWPDPSKGAQWNFLGWSVRHGAVLRVYLWCHILAGWTLSTLFIAGLTGLVRKK